jgi:hypothetical protein
LRKFKSNSVTNLIGTFQNLTKCRVDAGFILETPNVTKMAYAFQGFGFEADSFWYLPGVILSQVGTLDSADGLRGTFWGCGARYIEKGLLDYHPNITALRETFRAMLRLGGHWPLFQGFINVPYHPDVVTYTGNDPAYYNSALPPDPIPIDLF